MQLLKYGMHSHSHPLHQIRFSTAVPLHQVTERLKAVAGCRPPVIELDDNFTDLKSDNGKMTVAGFGSLLSERSARSTFPELNDFRPGKRLATSICTHC